MYETVLYAHTDIEKVRALIEASPALANADPWQESAPLPLPVAAYVGDYAWSASAADRVEIEERRGLLALRPGEGFARTLFHVGDHEFHPTGARSVRVRFEVVDDCVTALAVYDPKLTVTARRPSSPRPW